MAGAIALQQIDKRQGQLAFEQIDARRLTEIVVPARKVEKIIDELKSRSEIHAIVPQRRPLLITRATQQGADFAAGAKQESGLGPTHFKILVLRNIHSSEQRQLHQLAFGHLSSDGGENIKDRQG